MSKNLIDQILEDLAQLSIVLATQQGFQKFATTLSVSRFKDVSFINRYGDELAKQLGLEYVAFDLDAGEAHRKGLELSRQHGIYRQKYCGCEFSY